MTRSDEETPGYSLSSWIVLAMSAVMPVMALTGFSNFERGRHALLVLGAALLLIMWAVGVIRRGGVKVSAVGVAGLGVAFFALSGASFLWSDVPLFGVLSASTWVALGALAWVVFAPVGRAIRFADWSMAVGLGVIGAAALGMHEWAGGDLLTPLWDSPGVAGGFDAMSFAAAYYAVALPVVCGALGLKASGRVWRGVGIAALSLGTLHMALVARPLDVVIVASAAAVALLVGVVARRHGEGGGRVGLGRLALPMIVVAAGAAIGLVAFERPISPNDANDLPRVRPSMAFLDDMAADTEVRWPYFAIDRVEELYDGSYRPYLNAVTRGLYTQQPVIGHGAGGWWLRQTDVIHDGNEHVREQYAIYPAFKSPHSDFARISVEQGALGVALFALWLLGIVALVGGASRTGTSGEDERAVLVALTFSVVAGVLMMFRTPLLELGGSALVWTVAAAMLARSAADVSEPRAWARDVTLGQANLTSRALIAAVAALVGGAMIGPSVMNTLASLERGHADQLMLRTRFAEAIPQYQEAHRLYPAHAEVLFNQSLAHTLTGQARLGEPLIEEALELRPYDSRFLSQGTFVALALQRLDTALERGKESLRTGPNNLQGVDAYVAALQRRGRHQDAANVMEWAIKRGAPVEAAGPLHARLGQVYDNSLQRPRRAMEHYQRATKLLPEGAERMLVVNRLNELEKRLERERLIREGKPVPRHLLPQEVLEKGHEHGHGGPPGMPEVPGERGGHTH
ncbi:hypothetical protein FRC98_20680 [Lujinxingia vulgaris]|uniref:Uncharacterized protein n=1 Tax=Lujinxingia vulgaris TaxID=2600176 RepID=A0A5C6X4D4_9DELT|nr:hypothetical protein [Lujinxingia vulgaris]TXD33415.1 hypothetical protein FRC98_20680 [Lujinxingia vulgaris]